MTQYRVKQQEPRPERDIAAEDAANQKHPTPTTRHSDEVLADIDAALEDVLAHESAESFVRDFRQSSGE